MHGTVRCGHSRLDHGSQPAFAQFRKIIKRCRPANKSFSQMIWRQDLGSPVAFTSAHIAFRSSAGVLSIAHWCRTSLVQMLRFMASSLKSEAWTKERESAQNKNRASSAQSDPSHNRKRGNGLRLRLMHERR